MKRVEYYEDAKGEHRVRIKAKNGRTLLVSSEGYKNKADLRKAVRTAGLAIIASFMGG